MNKKTIKLLNPVSLATAILGIISLFSGNLLTRADINIFGSRGSIIGFFFDKDDYSSAMYYFNASNDAMLNLASLLLVAVLGLIVVSAIDAFTNNFKIKVVKFVFTAATIVCGACACIMSYIITGGIIKLGIGFGLIMLCLTVIVSFASFKFNIEKGNKEDKWICPRCGTKNYYDECEVCHMKR